MIGISTDTIVRATVFSRCSTRHYLQGQTSPPSIVHAERFWTPNLMQLLASRDYPVIDYQTMGEFIGRERLFRATDGTFVLHMSSEGKLEAEERIVWLTVRDAIEPVQLQIVRHRCGSAFRSTEPCQRLWLARAVTEPILRIVGNESPHHASPIQAGKH